MKKGNITIWDYHGGPNQHFYIKKAYGDKYHIFSVATGFTLEVPDSSKDNEIQVHTNPRNNEENELW